MKLALNFIAQLVQEGRQITSFNLLAFILVIITVLLAMVICMIIDKKNRLYLKNKPSDKMA